MRIMNNITGYLKKSKETKIKFNLKISVYMVKKIKFHQLHAKTSGVLEYQMETTIPIFSLRGNSTNQSSVEMTEWRLQNTK